MPEASFDLVVIGSGPGGYTAAIRASQLGMRVACVEKDKSLGGTCLNIGCIPSKALLDSSEFYHQAKHSFADHGVLVPQVGLDLSKMMSRKEQVVSQLTRGISGLFKKNKIEWVPGEAKITGVGKVQVGARLLSTKNILIATGSEPIPLPGAPFDGQTVVSSTEALSFTQVPKRLLVVGAGVIGLELGSVWCRLGAEVLVVELADRIVPGMDSEMTRLLQRSLEKQGIKFQLKTKIEGLKAEKGKVRFKLTSESGSSGSSEETADCALVAIGRRPFTQGLGLAECGVKMDPKGRIEVDAHFKSSVSGIYAIGDVITGPMLAHKASEEGVAAVEGMAGRAGHVNYQAIPGVVYTFPELASVGMTEDEAKAAGREIRVGKFPFTAVGRAKAMGETEGLAKIIADAKTDRILGVHILGPRASDLIAEAAVAIEFAASAEDIARSSHAHPTFAEALKEAALNVQGLAINI